jgi:hypothetical protein
MARVDVPAQTSIAQLPIAFRYGLDPDSAVAPAP